MAFGAFVQSKQAVELTGAVATLALPAFASNVTAGNSIIFYLRIGSFTVTVSSVTDTLTNTYTQVGSTLDGGGVVRLEAWKSSGIAGGADTVTVNLTGNATMRAAVIEYEGNFVLDKTAIATGTLSTAVDSGPTATTTQNNEAILGFAHAATSDVNWTAGASFTLREAVPLAIAGRVAGEDRVVSSTGTYSATFTIDAEDWGCIVATFYSGSAGVVAAKYTGQGKLSSLSRGKLAVHP